MLGWLVQQEGVALEGLDLRALVPSPQRGGVAVTFRYCQWLQGVREVAATTETLALRSIMQVAKFLYHSQSQARPAEGDKSCKPLTMPRHLHAFNAADSRAPAWLLPRSHQRGLHVVASLPCIIACLPWQPILQV